MAGHVDELKITAFREALLDAYEWPEAKLAQRFLWKFSRCDGGGFVIENSGVFRHFRENEMEEG